MPQKATSGKVKPLWAKMMNRIKAKRPKRPAFNQKAKNMLCGWGMFHSIGA